MNIATIDRLDDPRLDAYRDIRDRSRLTTGQFLAEGRETVTTLLRHSPFRPRSVLLTEVALDALRDSLAAHPSIDIFLATGSAMTELTGIRFQQGCVALGEADIERETAHLLASLESDGSIENRSIVVALDNVSNPDNVGSAFRNAFAFGAAALLLGPGCAHPLYRKTIRTSMGTALRVPFCVDEQWPEAIGALRQHGYLCAALDPAPEALALGSPEVSSALEGRRVALFVGNEGAGLPQATLAAADIKVRIEMRPEADSVNVATATGIALHRLAMTRHV